MDKVMNTITLSVCIPTYNRCHSLKKQLDYFKDENLSNVEVIVSDNCSTDGTIEFLQSYEKYDWLMVNINDTNIGADANINRLLELANGKYVLFLGDDYLKVGTIDKIKGILSCGEIDLLHIAYETYSDDGILFSSEISKRKDTSKYYKYDVIEKMADDAIAGLISDELSHFMFMSSNIYRREKILPCKEYSFPYGTTLLYSLQALHEGKMYYLSDYLVFSDPVTSWSEKQFYVWFEVIPNIIMTSSVFGFSESCIEQMMDGHIAQCVVYCIKRMDELRKYLKESGNKSMITTRVVWLSILKSIKLVKYRIHQMRDRK